MAMITILVSIGLGHLSGVGTETGLNIGLSGVVMAVILTIVIQRIYWGSAGPLYIVLAAVGMIAIDWMSRVAKPAIHAWLAAVGV